MSQLLKGLWAWRSELPDSGFRVRADVAELGRRWQLVLFGATVFAILSRRPDALLNPQFYAEDGAIWYSDAYHFGWSSPLLAPHTGYFQTLPRLVAAVALMAPLQYAPLVMNIVGILLQALPVTLLLSSRLSAWAPPVVRGAMAFAYLALPNTAELDATITEGQWHLALLACMVVLAGRPRDMKWRIFDGCFLLLSGLSGPFCLLLFPVALLTYWRRPARWRLAAVSILGVASTAQFLALLQTASATRSPMGLGASPGLFTKILAGQVYLGALIGKNGLAARNGGVVVLLGVVAVIGTVLILQCLWKAVLELRLFILFSALIFAASLANPMVSLVRPQWEVLKGIRGAHYWFFPMLGFVWALIWCATFSDLRFVRRVAQAGLIAMCVGIVRDWRYPPYDNLHFSRYVRELALVPEGTLVVLPINPIGWSVRLTKKGRACQTPPLGTIDEPIENAAVSGLLHVSGWVSGVSRIQQLSVYVDRSLVKSIIPNVPRPDIDRLYPESTGKEKGWQATVDISKAGSGKHELSIWAVDGHGCDAEIAAVSVERHS